jgi:hypothetical protein
LTQFGLSLPEDKTRPIEFAACRRRLDSVSRAASETFLFLGLSLYGVDRKKAATPEVGFRTFLATLPSRRE